jgi:hypothetical protein
VRNQNQTAAREVKLSQSVRQSTQAVVPVEVVPQEGNGLVSSDSSNVSFGWVEAL